MFDFATFLPFGWMPAAIAFVLMSALYQLWLSPRMFGRAWTRHTSIRPSDMRAADKRRLLLTSLLGRAIATLLLGAAAAHTLGNPRMLYATAVAVWLLFTFDQLLGVLARKEPVGLYFLLTLRSLLALLLGAAVYHVWSIL